MHSKQLLPLVLAGVTTARYLTDGEIYERDLADVESSIYERDLAGFEPDGLYARAAAPEAEPVDVDLDDVDMLHIRDDKTSQTANSMVAQRNRYSNQNHNRHSYRKRAAAAEPGLDGTGAYHGSLSPRDADRGDDSVKPPVQLGQANPKAYDYGPPESARQARQRRHHRKSKRSAAADPGVDDTDEYFSPLGVRDTGSNGAPMGASFMPNARVSRVRPST